MGMENSIRYTVVYLVLDAEIYRNKNRQDEIYVRKEIKINFSNDSTYFLITVLKFIIIEDKKRFVMQ